MSFPARLAVACLLAGTLSTLGGWGSATADPSDPRRPHARQAAESPYSTLAMRDLFVARRSLDGIDSVIADVLLARPTDGDEDPAGDGYRGPTDRRCGQRICVHFAVRGDDAPSSTAWVIRTLKTLGNVWDHEVDALGYRTPPADRNRGGDSRFDVYLVDVGERGLFGYCTPERRVRGERFAASSYCVLDDDFARRQFGARPMASLRVTAAHEFFHAVQFGYDFREDPWLLESTATWIEETFADGVDDNRRYLPYGTVRRPGVPLDDFANDRYAHYGTWAWWQFLADRYGDDVVRSVWRRADSVGRHPDLSSVDAVEAVLSRRDGLARTLTSYVVANLSPADSYAEGRAWPSAATSRVARLDRGHRSMERTPHIDHLAARHLAYAPARDLRGDRWRLRLAVDAPRRFATARVTVVRTDGRHVRRKIRLGRAGDGTTVVGFSSRRTVQVIVSLVNTSTRYRCGQDTQLACAGKPRDDGARFLVTARAFRR